LVYKFAFPKDKTNIELILIQAMLVLAAVAIFVYGHGNNKILSYFFSALLLAATVLAKPVLIAKGLNKWVLLTIAAILLFLTTWQVYFPLVLLFYGAVIKLLFKAPQLQVDENGVTSKILFWKKNTPWADFNAVFIKDGLLVLDYKNNQIKYLTLVQEVNEQEFNAFCTKFISQ
jgi:hypothetical protein